MKPLTIALLGRPKSGKTLFLKKLCCALDESGLAGGADSYRATRSTSTSKVMVVAVDTRDSVCTDLLVKFVEIPWHVPESDRAAELAGAHLVLLFSPEDQDLDLSVVRRDDLVLMTESDKEYPCRTIQYGPSTFDKSILVRPIELMLESVAGHGSHRVEQIISLTSFVNTFIRAS